MQSLRTVRRFLRRFRETLARARRAVDKVPAGPAIPIPKFGEALVGATGEHDVTAPVKSVFAWRESPDGWLQIVSIDLSSGPDRQPTALLASPKPFPPEGLAYILRILEFPTAEANFRIAPNSDYCALERWRAVANQQLPVSHLFTPPPLN
jgi:hypothetical protein